VSIRLARLMKESYQFTWHDSRGRRVPGSPRWLGSCHVVSVALVRSVWLVLKSRQFIRRDSIPWIPHPLSFSVFLFTFFLSMFSLHLAVAPLGILTSPLKFYPVVILISFMSWYSNRVGYIHRLHRLISLYFKNIIWMKSCGRDWRLN
jgi:hypothetical protein